MKRIILIICMLYLCFPMTCKAADTQEEIESEILQFYEFGELDEFLEETFPDKRVGFLEMVEGFISGDIEFSMSSLWELVSEQFFYEFRNTKSTLIHILAIVIIAAVFRNFSGVFQNSQTSEMCFYVIYILLVTICLNSFQVLMESAVIGINSLLEFLKLLGPVYFMAVAVATGSTTSVTFFTLILMLVSLVEFIILSFLLPLTQVYMVIKFLNDLSTEEYLSKFAEFLHTVIIWSLRTLLGAVIGVNAIQGMLGPAIDSVKRSIILRSGESIPIIGDAIGGTTEVVLGTAVLIKNGIGVAGAIICIAICMSPVIQMAVITLMYKLTTAVIQPISEKRVVECISSMADGSSTVLRVLFTTGILFLITIAAVANATL